VQAVKQQLLSLGLLHPGLHVRLVDSLEAAGDHVANLCRAIAEQPYMSNSRLGALTGGWVGGRARAGGEGGLADEQPCMGSSRPGR
jgi:hypothetical protein